MNWTLLIPIFIILILVPVIITGTTAILGWVAKRELTERWGDHGQITVGALGIILHEAGHAIMALIFHHKLDGLRLIQFRHFKTNDTLGYVSHHWDSRSFYQKLGNFFIGIAPFFTCTGFLYLAHRLLIGTKYYFKVPKANINNPDTVWYVLQNCSNNILKGLKDDVHNPKRCLIFILLVFMVSLTGYAISEADWGNTLKGIKQYLLFTALVTVVVFIAGDLSTTVSVYTWKFMALMTFLMFISWIYVLFSTSIVIAIRQLVDRYWNNG